MSPASNSVMESARYLESSPIDAKTSMLDHSISRNAATAGTAFNNLINIIATLLLVAILVLLELHIRCSMVHSHPAVIRTTNEGVCGISLHIPAESNAVER